MKSRKECRKEEQWVADFGKAKKGVGQLVISKAIHSLNFFDIPRHIRNVQF